MENGDDWDWRKGRMLLSLSFPLKPKVQASENVWGLFVEWIHCSLSFAWLPLSSTVLTLLFFLLPSVFMCPSPDILSSLPFPLHKYLSFYTHISICQHFSPPEAKVQQCVDLIPDWKFQCHLKSWQKLSFKAHCRFWWIKQQSPLGLI